MKFIDLYAGIGGFRYALESLGHECVFSAEKDKYAIETYLQNFPSHNPSFDMDILTKLSDEEINKLIPNHDILCAGFPCQPFSVGGVKKGFTDARGTQFFNILRVLDSKNPRFILLENVSNIISHDNGKTFEVIKRELWKRGYNIQSKPIIISPHEIGIPQRRYRAFFYADKKKKKQLPPKLNKSETKNIIDFGQGVLLNNYFQNVIKAWENFSQNVKTVNNKKIPDIWLDEMLSKMKPNKNFPDWKNKYLTDMNEFYDLNSSFIDSWLKKYKPMTFSRRERKFEWRAGKSDYKFDKKILMLRTSGLRVMRKNIFPTLVAMAQTPIVFDDKLKGYRHLTLNEVRKLQSFPKNFKFNKLEEKAMKQFGNSVNVEIVKQVASSFIAE